MLSGGPAAPQSRRSQQEDFSHFSQSLHAYSTQVSISLGIAYDNILLPSELFCEFLLMIVQQSDIGHNNQRSVGSKSFQNRPSASSHLSAGSMATMDEQRLTGVTNYHSFHKVVNASFGIAHILCKAFKFKVESADQDSFD